VSAGNPGKPARLAYQLAVPVTPLPFISSAFSYSIAELSSSSVNEALEKAFSTTL